MPMVVRYGIAARERSGRHPGDLRWPARRVTVVLAAYVAAAWLGFTLLLSILF